MSVFSHRLRSDRGNYLGQLCHLLFEQRQRVRRRIIQRRQQPLDIGRLQLLKQARERGVAAAPIVDLCARERLWMT